jgi:hypothetical protein
MSSVSYRWGVGARVVTCAFPHLKSMSVNPGWRERWYDEWLTIFDPIYREGHGILWDVKKCPSFFTGSYDLTRPLFVWQRPHETVENFTGSYGLTRQLQIWQRPHELEANDRVTDRLLTRGWFDSLSRFEWTRKTVDGTWNLKKKFFKKISKYKASALEDYAFT